MTYVVTFAAVAVFVAALWLLTSRTRFLSFAAILVQCSAESLVVTSVSGVGVVVCGDFAPVLVSLLLTVDALIAVVLASVLGEKNNY